MQGGLQAEIEAIARIGDNRFGPNPDELIGLPPLEIMKKMIEAVEIASLISAEHGLSHRYLDMYAAQLRQQLGEM